MADLTKGIEDALEITTWCGRCGAAVTGRVTVRVTLAAMHSRSGWAAEPATAPALPAKVQPDPRDPARDAGYDASGSGGAAVVPPAGGRGEG
jgi:hypothetical protein